MCCRGGSMPRLRPPAHHEQIAPRVWVEASRNCRSKFGNASCFWEEFCYNIVGPLGWPVGAHPSHSILLVIIQSKTWGTKRSPKIRLVPGYTRSMRAPSCEIVRSLAKFGELWRAHKAIFTTTDIHRSCGEGPPHSPEFRWSCLLYYEGSLQNVPPKSEFSGRISCGRYEVLRADVQSHKLQSGSQNPGRQYLSADIHDPKPRTSMTRGSFINQETSVRKLSGRFCRNPWAIKLHGENGVLIYLPVTSRPLISMQKEAVLCYCKFATAHLTACILNSISLELRDHWNGGPFATPPKNQAVEKSVLPLFEKIKDAVPKHRPWWGWDQEESSWGDGG